MSRSREEFSRESQRAEIREYVKTEILRCEQEVLSQEMRDTNKYNVKACFEEISETLGKEPYIDHILTAEDAKRFLNGMVGVLKSFRTYEEGNGIIDVTQNTMKTALTDVTSLLRDDVQGDFERVTGFIKDNPRRVTNHQPELNALTEIANVSALIRSSEDLRRLLKFAHILGRSKVEKCIGREDYSPKKKRLLESITDPKKREKLIQGVYGQETEQIERFSQMRELLQDSHDLSNYLRIVEIDTSYRPDGHRFPGDSGRKTHFLSDALSKSPDDARAFIALAGRFAKRGIDPQFVYDHEDVLATEEISEDGEGLLALPFELRGKWLSECEKIVARNTGALENIAPFISEGLVSDADVQADARKALDTIVQMLVRNVNGSDIKVLCRLIPEALTYLKKIDREDTLSLEEKTNEYLTSLGTFSKINRESGHSRRVTQQYAHQFFSDDVQEVLPHLTELMRSLLIDRMRDDRDMARIVIEKLDSFYQDSIAASAVRIALEHPKVAELFVQMYDESPVWKDEPWVPYALKVAQNRIEKTGETEALEKTFEEYNDLGEKGGLQEKDGYEDHFYRLNKEKILFARGVAALLRNPEQAQKEGEMSLNQEGREALQQIKDILAKEYEMFKEELLAEEFVPTEDTDALFSPENSDVKMNNLMPNVENFVGRYVSLLAEGNPEDLNRILIENREAIKSLVKEGFRKYRKAYIIDIPLYDKLYKELDLMRESGRDPMEVYIGRAFVQAYVGRRAQEMARKGSLDDNQREALEKSGEIISIRPQYIVYPRYFALNIKQEVLTEYLKQEQISHEQDPVFCDVGHHGLVPEHMMRIMGFDDTEIDARIHMLLADDKKRQVIGVPYYYSMSETEEIEAEATAEEMSFGLYRNPKTGKIQNVARPASPEDQFHFEMVKQAITRHYWVREKRHFNPFKTVNHESEKYRIRIKQECDENIPLGFLDDPEEYIATHAKGIQGDVDVSEQRTSHFSLSNGDHVVAKKFGTTDNKKAQREYMTLLRAKEENFPVPAPIGIVNGKEGSENSYVLLEYTDGVQASEFESYLRGLGLPGEDITQLLTTLEGMSIKLRNTFAEDLAITKDWTYDDLIVDFDEDQGIIRSITSVDWEDAEPYSFQFEI
ncbi:hypothetical protein KKH43_04185 [Patescibacteria group bacterium]|nr:hypothetical protein [Patescibacteria group bacterium]